MQPSTPRASFGSRNVGKDDPSPDPILQTEPSKKRKTKRFGLSDLAFYALLTFLGLAIIGFGMKIIEDPEVRQARQIEQAKADYKRRQTQAKLEKQAERERIEAARLAARPPLKLNSSKCRKEYGFVKYSGEVTNRTKQPIDNLMAVGVFRTSNGDHVKSASALIDFQPLLPGQRSPFTVTTSDNPAIKNCFVAFKTMFGAAIRFED